ncbi:hypothetical protein DPMN_014216 [Dreissena polymorpha]|uniref:THAP-type domain-containing protein n=1 Tax=Dreissena polymorpha TaxID=45954 RepID=A0A9D4S2I0_DREPO|nr:hypothetical protein DPMN_014216 [Dreissena polymorpha]
MVLKCGVYGCSNKADREEGLQYFRLPAIITNQGSLAEKLSTERRHQWLVKLNQNFADKNLGNLRICSEHFVTGM